MTPVETGRYIIFVILQTKIALFSVHYIFYVTFIYFLHTFLFNYLFTKLYDPIPF